MGRKRRSDSIQSIEEEKELLMEDEPVNDKIKRILEVILVTDLSISTGDVYWCFQRKRERIKKFEEFPYFLYKAVWDSDFEAIQWGDHENGETILINYELLDLYLNGNRYIPQRPEQYQNDYNPNHVNQSGGAGNRLHYNLVEIFGFNEIRENLETYMNFPDLAKFFFKLDNICMKHAIGERRGNWIEYHHSDFFKADNQVGQPPKRKNSKFFKICQTLKTDYRVRKFPMDAYNDRKKVPVENDPPYGHGPMAGSPYIMHQYPHYHIPREHFDDLNGVQPSPDFSNIDQESLCRAHADSDGDPNRATPLSDTDMFSVRSTVGSAIETN